MHKLYTTNIMSKVGLFIIVFSALILSGCKDAEASREEDIIIDESIDETDPTHLQTENGSFLVVPSLYIQDYENVKISDGVTVNTKGTLITCLSMIDSYWNKHLVEPDEFINENYEYIGSNGEVNIIEASNHFLPSDVMVEKTSFCPQDIPKYYENDNTPIFLIEIPHASIYGKNTTYLILTGISENGYAAIRDANRWNIENYAYEYQTLNGEYLYPLADILTASGIDSNMYVYRWKEHH